MYAIALGAVALVSLISQGLIQNYLTNQISDTHFINYAAKLRTESQTLIKHALLLEAGKDIRINLKDFTNTLRRIEKTQKSLLDGNDFLNIPQNTNHEIDELFAIIEHPYQTMLETASAIKTEIEQNPKEYNISDMVPVLLSSEKTYLLGMEMIVFEYDRLLSNNIRFLKKLEWILFAILIVSLCGEAIFIFRPLSKKLRDSFDNLVESEQKYRNLADELQSVNKELEESKQELIRHNNHIQKVRSELIIMGQERERKRIAAEIHDGIGQMLTALKVRIGMLEDSDDINEERFYAIEELLSSIVTETRKVCSELLPSVLEDFGLKAATNDLVNVCKSTSEIEFSLDNNIDETLLSREQSLAIYRIIQESLNNVCKHSKASEVDIIMESDAEMIFLSIADNGIGFTHNMNKMQDLRQMGKSYGLVNMKERADLLGGTFTINSMPQNGTCIELSIPLLS